MPYYREVKKKWIGQVRVRGRNVTKQFHTKKEAKKWESNYKEELSQTPMICLHDFAITYLNYSKVKHAPKTYREKTDVFKNFLKAINPITDVEDITAGTILGYLQKQAEARSGNAANKERKNLIAAWNYGIKYIEGFPQHNPCFVDRFPEVRKPRYIPPEKDYWRVYDVAESEQDEVLLLCYLHLAARRGEIYGLRWDDVDFSQQRVRLYTRKRRDGTLEYDYLPLTDQLYHALLEHRQQAVNEWVFSDPGTGLPYIARQQWMGRLCKKAKVRHFGIHAIRHLTASILAQAGVPMKDIQTILRHKNLSTTERYIHRLQSIRPALKVLEGKNRPGNRPNKKGHKLKSM